ncbi:MAG TPA: hypothetical protein DET40_15230 [Lentisphaeria bacterium]|nr:MAG: hypothetical protein A2X45_21810 [Lentisphaerae bacterium GWF2_50_93]HCE44892.1 hypothetical protein [Lentisphaeria bacterium]
MAFTRIVKKNNLKMRILVVDDEEGIRSLLQKVLEGIYEVETASSSAEALAHLKKNKFDIAISDVSMPGGSGKDFLKECRREYPEMQVILVTGMPELSDAVDTVKEGAYYYLQKPIDLKFLLSLLKRAEGDLEKNIGAKDTGIIRNIASDYKIIRSLGSGVAGVVLLVERDGMQYAMKVLRWIGGRSDESQLLKLKRFKREAEILMKIQNEHVVRIYEHNLDKENENPYIIMEYVDGVSLAGYMEQGAVHGLQEKISIIRQIAEALDCVHNNGVLHRDIKPENIIITKDNMVKVTDFGVCHVSDSSLTMTDDLIGSPAYMAPESFDSVKTIDQRSDIFSLGAISYELLTGVRPFDGGSIFEIMDIIRSRRLVAPVKLNSEIPAWMQDIMSKMLNKKPQGRFNNAGEIVKAVDHYLSAGVEGKSAATLTQRILRSMLFIESVWK